MKNLLLVSLFSLAATCGFTVSANQRDARYMDHRDLRHTDDMNSEYAQEGRRDYRGRTARTVGRTGIVGRTADVAGRTVGMAGRTAAGIAGRTADVAGATTAAATDTNRVY